MTRVRQNPMPPSANARLRPIHGSGPWQFPNSDRNQPLALDSALCRASSTGRHHEDVCSARFPVGTAGRLRRKNNRPFIPLLGMCYQEVAAIALFSYRRAPHLLQSISRLVQAGIDPIDSVHRLCLHGPYLGRKRSCLVVTSCPGS